jgi:hypothetical protein
MSSGRGAVGLLLIAAKYFADRAAASANSSFTFVSPGTWSFSRMFSMIA